MSIFKKPKKQKACVLPPREPPRRAFSPTAKDVAAADAALEAAGITPPTVGDRRQLAASEGCT